MTAIAKSYVVGLRERVNTRIVDAGSVAFQFPSPDLIYEENFGSCLILGASKRYGLIDHPVQTFGSRRCAIRKFAGLRSKFDDSHVSRKSSLQKLERVFARPHDRPKWVTGHSLSTPGTSKSDDLLWNAKKDLLCVYA